MHSLTQRMHAMHAARNGGVSTPGGPSKIADASTITRLLSTDMSSRHGGSTPHVSSRVRFQPLLFTQPASLCRHPRALSCVCAIFKRPQPPLSELNARLAAWDTSAPAPPVAAPTPPHPGLLNGQSPRGLVPAAPRPPPPPPPPGQSVDAVVEALTTRGWNSFKQRSA